MDAPQARRATAMACSVAASCGLVADDAVVLHNSNKLTVRLLPCDLVARIAPPSHQHTAFELDLAQGLARANAPVALPDPRVEPRVYAWGGFAVTLWTYYPAGASEKIPPSDYAAALRRLHAGLRTVEVEAPQATDRVESALQLLENHDQTPDLQSSDRTLLHDTLRHLGKAVGQSRGQQLVHGEPHPGNVLDTAHGPVFIDLETCCRGPVEFDLAHAPDEVSRHYPGLDQRLLSDSRLLMLAMITTWRWDRDDQLPNGRERGAAWLRDLRRGLARRPDGRGPEG